MICRHFFIDKKDYKFIELIEVPRSIKLKEQGGLWLEKALAKTILNINKSLSATSLSRTPVFVLINGKKAFKPKKIELARWSWLIPDMKSWYSYSGEKLVKHKLNSNSNQREVKSNIIALKNDGEITILPADSTSILDFESHKGLHVFSPAENTFVHIEGKAVKPSNQKWTNYAKTWLEWRNASVSPARLERQRRTLLAQSKELGLLLPISSFIVVESASQWETLQRKEKQSLSNHSALEFEDEQQASEPPWWLLFLGLLLYLSLKDSCFFRLRKK